MVNNIPQQTCYLCSWAADQGEFKWFKKEECKCSDFRLTSDVESAEKADIFICSYCLEAIDGNL